MTKLTIHAYDYWADQERDGFRTIVKYFKTRIGAEAWAKAHSKYVYRDYHGEESEAENETQLPTFEFTEIECADEILKKDNDVLVVRELIDKAVREYGLDAVKNTIMSILDFYK